MKVSVTRQADGFVLSIGEHSVSVDERALWDLLTAVTRVLPPGAPGAGGVPSRVFLDRLKGASDAGIQALLLRATEDDIVVLLKLAERDQALSAKLFGNMSPNSKKMYAEDLAYRFKEGLPDQEADTTTGRLVEIADELEQSGRPVFE